MKDDKEFKALPVIKSADKIGENEELSDNGDVEGDVADE